MIITIDGPTASGKSTVAHRLAQKLGYLYINSGLLFRAVAYKSLQEDLPLDAPELTENLDQEMIYSYTSEEGAQLFYQGKNITPFLKTAQIDQRASEGATDKAIRDALLQYQHNLATDNNIVADGRDCGTVVFPHADHKFYITADLAVRAERWRTDQEKKGNQITLQESMQLVQQRDTRDQQRSVAPLLVPHDAQVIDTSEMTIEQVVNACLSAMKYLT